MTETSAARPKLPMMGFVGTSLFFTGVSYAATLPYGGIVAVETLGMSDADYAVILSISSLVGAVIAVMLGYLSDRIHDRRLLVIACGLIGAVAFGVVYMLRDPVTYVVSTCLLMPFGGALFSQTFSYSRAYYNERRPERAEFLVTMLRTVFAIAWVVVPPIAGWIAAVYGVFEVYAVAAAACLICALIFTFMLSDPSTAVGDTGKSRSGDKPKEPARIARPMLVGMVGLLVIMIAIRLNGTVTPLAIVNNFGGTVAEVGIYAALAAFIEIPCMVAWGFAAQRIRKHWLIAAAAALFGVYLFLLGQVHTMTEVYWLQILNGITTAGLMSIPISYMQEAIRGRVGLSTSLLDVMFVGSALLSAGIFAIATTTGYLPLFGISALLALGGAAIMAGAHAVLRPRAFAAE